MEKFLARASVENENVETINQTETVMNGKRCGIPFAFLSELSSETWRAGNSWHVLNVSVYATSTCM